MSVLWSLRFTDMSHKMAALLKMLFVVWIVYIIGVFEVVYGQTCKNVDVEATCYCFDSNLIDLYLTDDKIKTVKVYGDCSCRIHYLVNPPYIANPNLSCKWKCDDLVCGMIRFYMHVYSL